MTFLYQIPAVVLLATVLVLAVCGSMVGQVCVHRWFRRKDLNNHTEVGGIIITVAGSLYAVLLGFMTVAAWQYYQDARDIAVVESNADIDVWHTAVGLPGAVRERVRADMVRYAQIMIGREWPLMREGKYDPEAAIVGMDAIDATGTFLPANEGEADAQRATMDQLTIIHDARQRRITVNSNGVSWFEWLILLIGALCIVSFCWLFGLKNVRVQRVMMSSVVVIITATLVLLFELQYPFRSDVGLDPGAWERALAHIQQMQSGEIEHMRM